MRSCNSPFFHCTPSLPDDKADGASIIRTILRVCTNLWDIVNGMAWHCQPTSTLEDPCIRLIAGHRSRASHKICPWEHCAGPPERYAPACNRVDFMPVPNPVSGRPDAELFMRCHWFGVRSACATAFNAYNNHGLPSVCLLISLPPSTLLLPARAAGTDLFDIPSPCLPVYIGLHMIQRRFSGIT